MVGHLGVMAEGDDTAPKVRTVWDVDAAAKVQEAILVGPFPRAQGSVGRVPELSRGFSNGFVRRSTNSLADVTQYVQFRSRELKAFKGACREDGWGEQDYVGVVSCTGPVIGPPRERVRLPHRLPGWW